MCWAQLCFCTSLMSSSFDLTMVLMCWQDRQCEDITCWVHVCVCVMCVRVMCVCVCDVCVSYIYIYVYAMFMIYVMCACVCVWCLYAPLPSQTKKQTQRINPISLSSWPSLHPSLPSSLRPCLLPSLPLYPLLKNITPFHAILALLADTPWPSFDDPFALSLALACSLVATLLQLLFMSVMDWSVVSLMCGKTHCLRLSPLNKSKWPSGYWQYRIRDSRHEFFLSPLGFVLFGC